jgi:hypothetical protein
MIVKIYCIRSNKTNDVYVGATTQKRLCNRIATHKSMYKQHLNGTLKKCLSSFNIVKYDDAYIELIEEKEVRDKDEMNKLEKEYIEKFKNENIPVKTVIETQPIKTDEEKRKQEYMKLYYRNNRDKLLEYYKDHFYCNTCKETISKANKSFHLTSDKHIKIIRKIFIGELHNFNF